MAATNKFYRKLIYCKYKPSDISEGFLFYQIKWS